VKFLIDANLPVQLAREFVDAGHECTHMETILPRYSPDATIARIANDTGAVVVSRDSDYVQFSRDGVLTVPLIWVHLGNLRRAAIASAIRTRLPAIVRSIEAGERIIEIR
jgi:predicted nuclease of predicted toxin-antitoxin system